ncbi:DNA polymerase zeta catalytic subunit [Pseudozyma hubeiensis]|nr:DNA polymerase zeta catalytic subunit [Pseudozyma hubeiensis]
MRKYKDENARLCQIGPYHATMTTMESAERSDPTPQRTEKTDSASSDPFFRVRLINIDHILTAPTPLDRTQCAFNAEGHTLRKVPILRIFGATPAGQRVCVHIHNVYPYCYIQYKGSLEPDDVLRYIHRLGRELNAAMSASLRRNPDDPELNQFVAAIHLCKGVNFYGYHVGYAYFLKISFVDPAHNYRIAAILESGGVMKTVFQPFEIHIRYQLQFMLDYNIFGCDYLDLDDVRFRLPIPDGSAIASDEPSPLDFRSKVWNRNSIPYAHVQAQDVHRGTHCELEADASAPWIINRRRLKERDIHSDFDEVSSASPDQNILVPSLSGLWDDERNRRNAAGLPPSIPTADPTRDPRLYATGESPPWMSEDRMRLLLEKRIIDEKQKTLPRERSAGHFTDRPGLDQYIMTTFDAVEVFHPYQDQIHAADPYSQRTGPSASFKLYDLQHAISQTQRGESNPTEPTQLTQQLKDQETDDFDTKFFRSQDFNHLLQQAEKEVIAANQDPPSDQEDDANDIDPNEPIDAQPDGPGTPRKWHRTDSSQSNMSTSSNFSKSPLSTPKKRQHADFLGHGATTPQASPSSRLTKEVHEDSHKATTLVMRDKQHMTTLAVEVLTTTRGNLFPDPAFDAVQSIIYSFQNEDEDLQDTGSRADLRTGLIIVAGDDDFNVDRLGLSHLAVEAVEDELELFNTLIDLVRAFDPEIIVGWEIHSSSWGYIIERASKEYDFDLVPQIGRAIVHNTGRAGGKSDNYAYTQSSALRITGRHTLNLWRLMKGELTLNLYTLENVCYHLLHRRIPKFSHQTLTQWFKSGRAELIRKALLYYIDMVELELEIIAESEFVMRTAEFARIYGIDFFSVISRGSQFKVESIMLRIAKPENFVLISPSRAQVGKQNAAECLPLIMEPQSAFYKGPLIVLDFQSLYPSIMIAYNLCYSTCLGRVSGFKGTSKFGVTEYSPPKGLLSLLQDDVNISSNGLLFVKPSVRKSLLAKMLSEILDTRVMVKGSMKGTKADKSFQRIQNARQLSLKLLANVTYGYTSASFSGRMPCVEIADAIVQTGRETLEKAMDLINGTEEWGAQVVYGDTDSLFVYLPGRTKEEAFRLGNTIADKVTSLNPRPVKLKFEKVYLPSVLLAKKRYVGFKYETLDEREPGFDAKGIETVRRDFHPAIQRMLEACIRILFRSRDLSLVKSYLQRQWRKILEGRVSPQDFIFAKEVRLGSYSDKVAPPPGAAVSSRRMLADPRSEPQYGERVPYIISQGEPRAKLNQQAVSPEAFLKNPQLQINALYYITRTIIPPLARVFNLLGADVEAWFHEMPKPNNAYWNKRPTVALLSAVLAQQEETEAEAAENADGAVSSQRLAAGKGTNSAAIATLNSHYATETCLLCSSRTEALVCLDCRQSPQESIHAISSKLHNLQSQAAAIDRICSTCAGMERPGPVECISLDCPYTYQKTKVHKSLEDTALVNAYVSRLFDSEMQRQAGVEDAWSRIEGSGSGMD